MLMTLDWHIKNAAGLFVNDKLSPNLVSDVTANIKTLKK